MNRAGPQSGKRSPSVRGSAADGSVRRYATRLRERLTVDHLFVAVVVATWIGLYLNGLGEHPLRVWDESRYAAPARHMAESGNWLDPQIRVGTHGGDFDLDPRLVKPPLIYWLQGAAMVVLGVTEFAARLPTALATLGCAGLVYHIGARTYDRRAGLAGALVLLVFPGMLLGSHGGRAAVTDTTLALFGSGFVWFTWRGRERPHLLVVAGICAGLAVMTKGVAAGVFVVAVAPFVLRYLRAYLTRWTVAAVASTVVVALPWHLYAWLTHGEAFVQQYFLTAVASRADGEMTAPPDEPLFEFMNYPYFRYAFEVFGPPYPYALPVFMLGVLGAIGLVVWLVRRDGRAEHADAGVLMWWAAAVPLTFAVAGGNHAWYLLPMYVPGSVLLGYVAAAVADGTMAEGVRHALGDRFQKSRLGLGDRLPSPAALRDRWSPTVETGAYAVVCVCVALVLVASYAPAPADAFDAEQRDLGETVAAEVPDDERLHVWLGGDAERRALMSLSFYADRPLERTSPSALDSDAGVRYAIVPIDDRAGLDRDHRVLAEGPVNGVAVVAFADRGE